MYFGIKFFIWLHTPGRQDIWPELFTCVALFLAIIQCVPWPTFPFSCSCDGQFPGISGPHLSHSQPLSFSSSQDYAQPTLKTVGKLGGSSCPQITGDGSLQINAPDSYALETEFWDAFYKGPQWDNQLSDTAFIIISSFLVSVFLPFPPASWDHLQMNCIQALVSSCAFRGVQMERCP